jgi:acetylornithine aminotransferase
MPDVLTLAKALGNGVPIGACLASGKAATLFQPGSHGSTYGGNPLVCRAALAVIETIETENLVSRAHELGQYFYQGFSTTLADIVGVRDIRVKGLMIGIELDQPCSQLMNQALDKQLLINVTAQRVIRLLPPLIISNAQADEIINIVTQLVREFYRSPVKH